VGVKASVDGFARPLVKVLRDGDDHTVIDVGWQFKGTVEHLLLPVFAGLGVHAVLSRGSLQCEISVSSVNAGPRRTKW
jgi:hypothetical protein